VAWAHITRARGRSRCAPCATGREDSPRSSALSRVTTGAHPEGVRRQAHRHRAPRVQHVPDDFCLCEPQPPPLLPLPKPSLAEQAHAVRMKLSTEVFDEVEKFAAVYASDTATGGDV
jgi:hypothetical protein